MSFSEIKHLASLNAYVPGEQPQESGWIKLNTNENCFPPSPKVSAAIQKALPTLGLYPDPDCQELRSKVASFHKLDKNQVIIGNGSDDLLNLLFRAYTDKKNDAAMLDPSYSHYPVLSEIQGSRIIKIPLTDDLDLDVKTLKNTQANILFLTSPNAPLSFGFSNQKLKEVVENFEGLVVIDEAYADFASENAVGLLQDYNNVFLTRTFSKSYALAGLRVGYGLGSLEVIKVLNKVRDPYNVNKLSQVGAIAALDDLEYYQEIIHKILVTRDQLRDWILDQGWKVHASCTNFLFMEPCDESGKISGDCAKSVFEFLKKHKILVRYFPKHSLTQKGIRVTIGTEQEMDQFKKVIMTWIEKEKLK